MATITLSLFDATARSQPRIPRETAFAPDFATGKRLYTELAMRCTGWGEVPCQAVMTVLQEPSGLLGILHRQARDANNQEALPDVCDDLLEWFRNRPVHLRSTDGLELLWTLFACWEREEHVSGHPVWLSDLTRRMCGGTIWRWDPFRILIWWLMGQAEHEKTSAMVETILDGMETSFALVPHDIRIADHYAQTSMAWRSFPGALAWKSLAMESLRTLPTAWSPEALARLWGLLRFLDEPAGLDHADVARFKPATDVVIACHRAGVANDADVFDHLLSTDDAPPGNRLLEELLVPRTNNQHDHVHAYLEPFVRRIASRMLECERHGTLTDPRFLELTLTSSLIPWSLGEKLAHCLSHLEPAAYATPSGYDYEDHRNLYIRALNIAEPDESGLETFTTACHERGICSDLLISLSLRNPRLASWCEHAAAAPGLADIVSFADHHAIGIDHNNVPETPRGPCSSGIIPIDPEHRAWGVVDLKWFERVRNAPGGLWDRVHRQLDICPGSRSKRLKVCCDAMLGRISLASLEKGLFTQRKQASVIALGLLPLPEANRDAAILALVHLLRRFLDSQKNSKIGAERKANERLVYLAALRNLANRAGLDNPSTLEWLIEVDEAGDLHGSEQVDEGDLSLVLSIDDQGRPQLHCTRSGKALKTIPALMKSSAGGKALIIRHKDLLSRTTRFRSALEITLADQSPWVGSQLRQLSKHPMLAPMLNRLAWVRGNTIGWLADVGTSLHCLDGSIHPIATADHLTMAHPLQLANNSLLQAWQYSSLADGVIQPIKQLFRELYLPTAEEQTTGMIKRFNGIPMNARQAWGILSNRGWRVDDGSIVKRRNGLGEIMICIADASDTPWDMGEFVIDEVHADRPTSDAAMIWFSESMRDIDLAASIAAIAGRRTSNELLSFRRRSVEEMAAAMKRNNVACDERHALVSGNRSSYSIELASGEISLPSGRKLELSLCKDRDLPFLMSTDKDDTTARILATVLLLSDDAVISDRAILDQIGMTQSTSGND